MPWNLEEALLLKRRSVRKFTNEPVSKEDIDKLLHAAMSGPSAVNKKPWEFYVVQDPEKIAELNKVGFAKYPSSLMIVVAGNRLNFLPMGAADYWIEDVSSATENILLEATNLGLGACWCGVYPGKDREKQVHEILGMPLNHLAFNIIIIGHPDGPIPEARDQYEEKKVHYQ
jgi:nitroreductase